MIILIEIIIIIYIIIMITTINKVVCTIGTLEQPKYINTQYVRSIVNTLKIPKTDPSNKTKHRIHQTKQTQNPSNKTNTESIKQNIKQN